VELAGWFQELKRRRVLRVLVGYGIATFAILQVVEPVVHGLHGPDWVVTAVVVAVGLGLPLALALAWAFDLQGGRLVRTGPAVGGSAPSPILVPALEAAAGGPSIAVLPFADLSPAKDQDYFCDGIAEELLNALAGVPGLRVAARGSSFQFKGRPVDSREIGRALGVTSLLEGSVRKAGERVRVSAQLVSGGDGYQLWSETFERGLQDIFAIQEEIAQAVVRALKVRLGRAETGPIIRAGTRNTRAYEMYLRGRQFLMALGEENLRFARQMLKGAIELDPGFAQAHAGLADAAIVTLQWNFDPAHAEALRAEALAESEEALRLDPKLSEAFVSRANLLSQVGRAEEADRDFRRALDLNPGLSDAHYFFARHLVSAGRPAEAAEQFEEAARVNPDDYASLCLVVTVYRGLAGEERAREASRRALAAVERRLRVDPGDVRALYLGAGVRVQLGERDRGVAMAERVVELQPDDFTVLYNAACVFAVAGESQKALDALDRAVVGGRGFRKWIENDHDLDAVRGDPRFAEILARVKA
jgi:adenylate cyclase